MVPESIAKPWNKNCTDSLSQILGHSSDHSVARQPFLKGDLNAATVFWEAKPLIVCTGALLCHLASMLKCGP